MTYVLLTALAVALVACVLALGREVRLRKALEKLLRIIPHHPLTSFHGRPRRPPSISPPRRSTGCNSNAIGFICWMRPGEKTRWRRTWRP